jgi:glycosyltransferase EpsF
MSQKIKILHVVPAIFEGGVGSVVNNYYEKIDKTGFSFDIITHTEEINKCPNQLYENSNIYYLKSLGKLGIYGYCRQLKTIINCSDYDIVHIHVGHITGIYAMIYKYCGAKKIILHAHSTSSPVSEHEIFMPLLRLFAKMFSNKLLSCGKLAGEFCFGNNDFTIIKNGIDFNKFSSINYNSTIKRKSLGFKYNDIILGNVASFIEQKNHKYLLQVFLELSKSNDNYKLLLVGKGPKENQIVDFVKKNNLSNKVFFLGQRNDVYELMNLFDVFLLPSLFEGLPVTGIEAQAAGTRCVFSDTIDPELDLGIGLSTFLPIDKGTGPWVNYLKSIDIKKAEKEQIKNALIVDGYEINHSVKMLENIYLDISKR